MARSNSTLTIALLATALAATGALAQPWPTVLPEDVDEPPQMLEAIQVSLDEGPEDFTEATAAFIRTLRADDERRFWQCSPFDDLALAARDVLEEIADVVAPDTPAIESVVGLASLEPPAAPLKLLYSSVVPPAKKRPVGDGSWMKTAQAGGALAATRAIALPAEAGPRFRLSVVSTQGPLRWQSQMRVVQTGESTNGPTGSDVLMVKTDASANTLTPVPEPLRLERQRVAGADPMSMAVGVGLAGRWTLPLAHRLDFDTIWQERRFRDGAQRDGGVRQMGLVLGTPTLSGFSGQFGLKRADEQPRDPWLALRAEEIFVNGIWSPAPNTRFTVGLGTRRTRFNEVDPGTLLARDDRQDRLTFGWVERVKHSLFGPMNVGVTYAETRSRMDATGFETQAREARLTLNKTF